MTRFSDFCETVYFEPDRYLTILSDSDFCENVVLRGTRPQTFRDNRISRLCANRCDQYLGCFVLVYQGSPGTNRHVSAC